jgi:hypothetical protein
MAGSLPRRDGARPAGLFISPEEIAMTWKLAGWCYHLEKQRVGPVATEEIVRLLNRKELRPEDEVLAVWHVSGRTLLLRSRAIAVQEFDS